MPASPKKRATKDKIKPKTGASARPASFKASKNAVDEKKRNPYRCPTCEKRFPHLCHLDKHYKEHHGSERPVKCPQCPRRFYTERKLKEHTSASHESNDSMMVVDGTVQPNGAKKESEMPRRYKCKECGKAYAFPSRLKIHVRNHTGERPYVCKICDIAFTDARALRKHHRTTQVRRLRGSIRSTLPAELPHAKASAYWRESAKDRIKCPKCARTFVHKQSLQRHMVKHSGEKPFKCDSCEASYKYAWDLTKHKRREHSQEGTDDDWVKMETVEIPEEDEQVAEPAQLPTSSSRASKRRKSATDYRKTAPVKVDPDALVADIVSIKDEVKTEPFETA
ncbi:hypothetical protein AAVH_11485 [Aphelenchoides avenae]|nr:hypothetical protein AAVH_11485 [Aphelenchus avenae]